MTFDIALVLSIVALAVLLFVTERIRVDLVALLVLGSLALTGLVTPTEALSGFSNPAVVTVWAVFILSSALSRTGVANIVGHQVLRLAGPSELSLLTVIMLTAAVLSAFMNNVGVAALLLPVVMDIARRTGRPPSRLLIPLAFGSLLGGLTTLIGTPPNILISDILRDYGLQPFQLFDYAPVGLVVMLVGTAFMVLVGRHLLPVRDIAREFSAADQTDLGDFYHLQERLFVLHVPSDSALAHKTLDESRLGAALGLNVIAVMRQGQTQLAPTPETVLRPDDRLLVQGRRDTMDELDGQGQLLLEDHRPSIKRLVSTEVELAEVRLASHSPLAGQTLPQIDFRQRFGVIVLAIRHDGVASLAALETIPMRAGDTLLVQGPNARLEELRQVADFDLVTPISEAEVAQVYHLQERLIAIDVSSGSIMAGRTLVESRLGDAFGLTVLGIIRDGATRLMPSPQEQLQTGDTLLVKGTPEALLPLRALQDLEVDRQAPPDLSALESERVGMSEVVLSPHTTLAGKSLRQLHFRDKYGLNVLAIWRGGRAYRTNLRDMPLQFGDALLLYGSRDQLRLVASEPDFLVLTESAQEVPLRSKAPLTVFIMVAALLPVILGWLPIAIAVVVGATLMILTGALTMEEAYRYIEWKAVFLIAGMLPLGIAMEQTGAASLLAETMVALVGGLGPRAVMASLFILAALTSQVMPNPAVAVLLAPVALSTAGELGISPYALMMTVAISSSASFLSPVAHPANLLVLGPGGYRFTDYIKVGLPLTLLVLITVLLVLPIFWPLVP
jgi:di/tricarboxylate transporter